MPIKYALLYPKPDFSFEVVIGRPFHLILKEAREQKGIGIRELSRNAGCSHVYLLKIEQGERTPSPSLLNELQRELEIDPFFLVPEDELNRLPGEELHLKTPRMKERLKRDTRGLSFLTALLVTALQRGGFEPIPKEPTKCQKNSGVQTSITLGNRGAFEILIKST
jgi:transcriptional regulator with XRE-family HTH domain